jgi:hypothetical protein
MMTGFTPNSSSAIARMTIESLRYSKFHAIALLKSPYATAIGHR